MLIEPQNHRASFIVTTEVLGEKIPFLIAMILTLLMGMPFQGAVAQRPESTPDADTKTFDTWYIKLQSNLVYPLLDKSIHNYVSKDTVDKLRDAYHHDNLRVIAITSLRLGLR